MSILADLRYGVRLLLRTPAFTGVAVLTLALGVGANTAIFTVVNALLLRPLPYGSPDGLVMVWQDLRVRGGPADEWVTPGNYVDWRREAGLFDGAAVISGWRPTLTGDAEPEPLPGEQVSHEYFAVLGIQPSLGRTFASSDDVPNAARVAIIGHGLWERRFGADPSIVGRSVTLSGESHEIIGVLPDGFRPIVDGSAEIWRPLRIDTANPSRGAIIYRSIARLPQGTSVEQAQAAADVLSARLEAAYPEHNDKMRFSLTPLHERVIEEIKPGLLAMLGAVAFVLLIACANIANLLLARGSARGRELAVRLALGAGRRRVLRQLLTESLLLAALGGVAGLLLGVWAVDALVAIAPANAPRLEEISLDPVVFAFAGSLVLVTGIACGLAPALQYSRASLAGTLKDGARGTAGGAGGSLRRALIAAEVALALVLLAGAGLLLQTFLHLRATDLGFRPDHLIAGFVNPPRAGGYDTREKYRAFYDQVFEKAKALPGVQQAALASVLPLSGDTDTTLTIEGRPAPGSPSDTPATWFRIVSASYFETMGIPIRRGRGFEPREPALSAIVNETFVRTYSPDREPLGRRIRLGGAENPWLTIVGVAGDVKGRGARGRALVETYVPYWHLPQAGMNVILKAGGPPETLTAPLRQAVASIDRNVPVSAVVTLAELVSDSIDHPRFFATLSLAFAVVALALAAIGIYGVMAYAVSQRTMEIGVRMALGATPGEVFRHVVADGLRLTAAGVAAGIAGSLLVARWLASLLFGVGPADPATLGAMAAALLGVAGLACFVPARRATRVDPVVALRAE